VKGFLLFVLALVAAIFGALWLVRLLRSGAVPGVVPVGFGGRTSEATPPSPPPTMPATRWMPPWKGLSPVELASVEVTSGGGIGGGFSPTVVRAGLSPTVVRGAVLA